MDNVFKPVEQQVVVAPTEPQVNERPAEITLPNEPLRINSNPDLSEVTVDAPYANTFLKTETPFDFLPSKVQGDLKTIDEFVGDEISQRGWKHNVNSYNKVMQELDFEMGLSDESMSERIERLGSYAKNMLKIKGIDSVKTKLLRKLKTMQPKDMDKAVMSEIGRLIL
jgi:hypothetical protein